MMMGEGLKIKNDQGMIQGYDTGRDTGYDTGYDTSICTCSVPET